MVKFIGNANGLMRPDSLLPSKTTTSNFSAFLIPNGIEPLNAQSSRNNSLIFCNLPIAAAGTVPDISAFPLKSKYSNDCKYANALYEIGPINIFLCIFNTFKRCKNRNDSGICPINWFPKCDPGTPYLFFFSSGKPTS